MSAGTGKGFGKPPPNQKFEELKLMLKNHMTLELERGNFTDPNNRTIVLKFDDEKIASVSFDVVQKREYEG